MIISSTSWNLRIELKVLERAAATYGHRESVPALRCQMTYLPMVFALLFARQDFHATGRVYRPVDKHPFPSWHFRLSSSTLVSSKLQTLTERAGSKQPCERRAQDRLRRHGGADQESMARHSTAALGLLLFYASRLDDCIVPPTFSLSTCLASLKECLARADGEIRCPADLTEPIQDRLPSCSLPRREVYHVCYAFVDPKELQSKGSWLKLGPDPTNIVLWMKRKCAAWRFKVRIVLECHLVPLSACKTERPCERQCAFSKLFSALSYAQVISTSSVYGICVRSGQLRGFMGSSDAAWWPSTCTARLQALPSDKWCATSRKSQVSVCCRHRVEVGFSEIIESG